MKCTSCQSEIPAESAFCPHCGAKVTAPAAPAPSLTLTAAPNLAPQAIPAPNEPLPNAEEAPVSAAEAGAEQSYEPYPSAEPSPEATPVVTLPTEPTVDAYPPPASYNFDPLTGGPITPAATSAPAPAPESVTVPNQPRPRRKRPVWLRIICGFASAILLTITIVLGIAAGAILMVRNIMAPDTITQMISQIDLTEMEITIQGETKTVSDVIHDAFSEAQAQIGNEEQMIDVEQIEELLEADFVQDFLSDTANSLSEDLLGNTSNSELTVEDVNELIVDNREDIEEILEVEVTDEMIDGITAELEETQVLQKLSVTYITDEVPVIKTVTSVLSGQIAGLLLGGMLFFLLLIAFVNGFRPIALSYAGAAFLTVGGLFGILAMLIRTLVELIADLANISTSILDFAVGGIVSAASQVFVIGFIAGLLLIAGAVAYTILRSTLRKKVH
ncbi:MAG: zinc-ribbon domain-containing protein [Clostridia bacterium]|nr:zinc-ribbon domain-containing protein [Clostridia bacterium]